jgi:hypothetical protein
MAKGKKCSCCGYYMYAEREDYEEKGTWVYYVCRNENCSKCKGKCTITEKVFEKSD